MKLILRIVIFGCLALSLFAAFFIYVTNPSPAAPSAQQNSPAPPTATAVILATATPPPIRPTATPVGYLSRATLGDKWPLLVDDGIVRCNRLTGGVVVVIFRSGDKTYAVNGMAKARIEQFGWEDIATIQNMEKTATGLLKYPVTPILDLGLTLCP